MSKRRQVGDWVRLKPQSGFVRDSDRFIAEIREDGEVLLCLLPCGDICCREWSTLWTAPDPLDGGKRQVLCHVSECRMLDIKGPDDDEG